MAPAPGHVLRHLVQLHALSDEPLAKGIEALDLEIQPHAFAGGIHALPGLEAVERDRRASSRALQASVGTPVFVDDLEPEPVPIELECLREPRRVDHGVVELEPRAGSCRALDRKSTSLNSSHLGNSYGVF